MDDAVLVRAAAVVLTGVFVGIGGVVVSKHDPRHGAPLLFGGFGAAAGALVVLAIVWSSVPR